jgi:hypothetical protein
MVFMSNFYPDFSSKILTSTSAVVDLTNLHIY